jgi:hypothetical protein
VHDLGLGHTWEFSTALGKASYEVPELLAGLLGARSQVPGVPGTHVRVTTPPEITPYYHLNHSFWSLSDNKEVSR